MLHVKNKRGCSYHDNLDALLRWSAEHEQSFLSLFIGPYEVQLDNFETTRRGWIAAIQEQVDNVAVRAAAAAALAGDMGALNRALVEIDRAHVAEQRRALGLDALLAEERRGELVSLHEDGTIHDEDFGYLADLSSADAFRAQVRDLVSAVESRRRWLMQP